MYLNIIKWAINNLGQFSGTMADDDYNKKLGEMQKYVPFLETTIKRLKSEKDKPREAQITKLQSLLVILTDSKKKLKLDALKKCEEVILKLYDKVEKKPVTMMHKYMCRTPPEQKKSHVVNESKTSEFDPTFIVARQKLKQTDATPASPSPPPLEINITKPVIIPTEKISEPVQLQLQSPHYTAPNWENYQTIPQTLNWPVNAFNPVNVTQVWQDPNSQNWTMPPSNPNDLYKRRTDQTPEHTKKDIWDREALASNTYNKHKKIDREIINYSDALSSNVTTPETSNLNATQVKIVGNNKEIIPIDSGPKIEDKPKMVSRKNLPLPPAPQSRKSLEKEILPLNKPPLTDRDLRDLLSPVTESSSGGHSPIFNEDMDLDKLEELKAKLCRELADEKPKHKKKIKDIKSAVVTPSGGVEKTNSSGGAEKTNNSGGAEKTNSSGGAAVATPTNNQVSKKPAPKVVERVIKEQSNVFGSLLSSIDEQIMCKNKDKKIEKKDPKIKDKKEPIQETKALNIKDVASMNEKVKSAYLKTEDKATSNKPKDEKKSDKKKPKEEIKDKKSDQTKRRKSTDKPEKHDKSDKYDKSDKHDKSEKHDKSDKPKDELKPKDDHKKPSNKTEIKEIVIDDQVFKTVENIMKNLKDSINKPVTDPLSKFGDLVKEKSDQLCDNSKTVEVSSSGRLSDKYPHKRKSIESRASDSPLSDTSVPKIPPEPVKLTDPRIRTTKVPNIVSPPPKEPPQVRLEVNNFEQRNYNKPNADFSFQNSYNNMNTNFNRGNNIFCNEPPQPVRPPPLMQPHMNENAGCRTPGDSFLMRPRTPGPVDQFIQTGPPRTPGDPFLSGPRTPGDPFLNPPRTPGDPFLNSPRTPGDPFLNPGEQAPFMNRPQGPEFHNFNQFPPKDRNQYPPKERNQFAPNDRNHFPPMNRNQDFNQNHHDRFNPNWNRPNNQFQPEFNNQNPRFNQPDQSNQYDLSQMNPIDFYDNNAAGPPNTNNRFEPEFNNQHPPFRGRGNMRGNFVRGRGGGGPDRNPYRDPRQFRNMGALLQVPKFPTNEEPPHKEERRSRFDDPRDSRGDRDYRRSRFSKEEEHRNDRARSTEDRYNRFGNKREEPVRKPGFVREDPRRKSIDEPKEIPVVVDKSEKPKEETKPKEEIQSPLDSLYSTETKRVGKGYGLQSFKIPKIKKNEEIKEDTKPTPEEKKEEKVEEEPPKHEEVKTKEEAKTKEEVENNKSPDKKEEIVSEVAGPSKPNEDEKETPKTEADLKLDMFNNFMKHIFETCDSSVLFQYLDRCGFSLPNAKTKRIRRIIDSDSSDTEDEQKKDDSETDKPTPEPPAETPEPEDLKTNEPDLIVESVSERIKNRRRKQPVYSSDSSPDKSQKAAETDKPEDPNEGTPEKVTRKSRSRTPKKAKPQAKTRRKNALELLQEDIREMFISEGVLTATGKRMCRMMKEHQESGFIPSETVKPLKDSTESDEEIPLVKRKEKLKTKLEKSPESIPSKKPTRKSPRVILEKIEISKTEVAASTDHSEKESEAEEEIKKPTVPVRRTRRSNTVSGEFLALDENGVVVKVQEKKKKQLKSTSDEADALDTSFEDDASIKSDTIPKKEETPGEAPPEEEAKPDAPVTIKKKRIRRRGRGGWATGVIKNKKKKLKTTDKNPESPALTVSTEDLASLNDPQENGSDEETPKNRSEPFDEEYSLLQVDVNEDVNYYLDNGNKFNCKLCDYKGKLIVHHYRSKHPESENMISRLSPEQASAAKIESNEFNFEEIIPYEEAIKGKKRRTTFICRFCLLTFKQEFTCSFFDHICCHTGEYRYKCEKCAFSTGVKKTLSAHCHTLHPEMEKPLVIKPIYEGPPNFRLVFGYLCSVCNFTQLLKQNVEKHIRVSHPDQDITIIKISMSTKPIPLTDLKKPGDETPKTNETNPEVQITPGPLETKQSTPEPPKTPKKSKGKPEPEVQPPQKEKEPNLTVFMVPEEISQQEKLIESERLKKMEEIQCNVVPRRPKLQFVDKLKNKLDSVQSEIDLLESMEAENAALEAEASALEAATLEAATLGASTLRASTLEASTLGVTTDTLEAPTMETPTSEASTIKPSALGTSTNEAQPITGNPEAITNDKPEENWIAIASTCSLANADFDDEPSKQLDSQQNELETLPENNSSDDLDNESLNSLNLSPSSIPHNAKKTGFMDTIQRLAAQLQNNKPSSMSDCEDGERLYYSPEVTPENSPRRKMEPEDADDIGEAIKLNAGSIEIQFFGNKNIYSCLIPECNYTTNLKTCFRKHLMDEHKNLRVNCGLCVDECDYMEWDLCGLFIHMLDQHKQETPKKPKAPPIVKIKEEPVDQPEISIKTEIPSPEKQPEVLQAGSIRLRRISGDILSSFSAENSVEYPTISIPENVVSEPEIGQIIGEPPSEPGFLQISNVRTLTPEEENHLQIKTASPVKEQPKAFKKIIPKAYILNMGDLATTGVTKIVNNSGSSINLKRATGKESTTFNFTLNTNSGEASPKLLTKTITSENKPTKTIIFRKTTTAPSFLPIETGTGVPIPKLTLLKSPKTTSGLTLTKGFIATTASQLKTSMNTAKKITFVAPSTQIIKPALSTIKPPQIVAKSSPTNPTVRLNKPEFVLTIMTEHPKILDFYKCPSAECIFSTNERAKFQEHFATHNRTTPGKYCVYCFSTVNPNDLIDHLEYKHGNCKYQCALCFYRACFDIYIAVHQSSCHQIDIPKFYTIKTPSFALNCGPDDELLLRTDAILPYYCTTDECNSTFYTINDFRVHMKVFHKRINICSICKYESSNVELLVGHYVTHNIANFQCRYCNFGSESPHFMLKHCAMEHYNKHPIVYKREFKAGTMVVNRDDASRLENIIEINLSYLAKTNRLKPLDTVNESQNHIPAASTSLMEEPDDADDVSPLNLNETVKESLEQSLIDPTTGEILPAPEKDGLNEPEITLKHRNEQTLQAIVNAVDPLTIDEESRDTEENDENDETDVVYEDSGLIGCELFVCGTSECGAKLPNLKEFKDHMYSCDVLANDAGWFTCFHCKKRFKYVGALIKHLTVHGPQKYTCSLCPAKAHLETLIIKHMKIQHKITVAKVVPIDKTNPESDFVAVVVKPRANKQKSKKDDELYEKELQDAIKHTREQIELIQNDKNTKIKCDDKNSFGPEDIDKLPRPPIFAQEIKCKICSYNTKVRSNMLKHLKAHIENKPVAETAPVNPVPCLEKNELMFDKMTNLAASSHSGGRMGAKKDEKIKENIKTTVQNYPGFIAASKRFVCGSNNCNYLTHGDSMLRHHLTALHIDEVTYKCPHCQLDLAPDGLNVLAVDNILFHLKMHDLHLYKCNECKFFHYQKHKIERHLIDEHPNSPKSSFTIIRELDGSANLEEVRSTPSSPEKPRQESEDATQQPWRCGFCEYKTATRASIQSHAASVHKIRSQFKCGSFTDESSSNLSSSDVEKSFDTTPLWTKNKTGVKHIRGILLDDSPVAKRPKIIEKLAETATNEDETKVKQKVSSEAGHNLRFPATYGTNRNKFYVCPTCNTYETKNSKQFVIHLYKEINYFRYMCNFCAHKSTHMAEAQKHYKESHSAENIVNNKQICTVLRYYAKAEKWVEKCLQVQQEGILKYETELIKQETPNSSTETLLLQIDEEEAPNEEEDEEMPEKPQLTPQQNRRSSRVSTKTIQNLNESFDTNELSKTEELSPPLLEPQIPEKIPKKPNLKCEHCMFVAKAPGNLQKHVRKHFEVKPYKCNLCKYEGSQLAHLQSHFYFKHTSEPLQYTVEPLPEVPQCHPIKRKRAHSMNESDQPTKIQAIDEPIIKAEPQNEMLEVPPLVRIKSETSTTDLNHFYVCYHCPRRGPTLDVIREHFFEAHEKQYKNLFKYKKLTIEKPKKTKYTCQYCEWVGPPDGLKQHHLQNHIDKEFICVKDVLLKCEVCTEVFNKLGLLKKHFHRSHPNHNIIYQSITKENDDEYIETVEIIEEVLQVKMEKPPQDIQCAYCVLSFGDGRALRAHHDLVHNHLEFNEVVDEVREELKKYKCPQCEHTSNSFPAMRDHLRNHNKPYKCGHCDLTASYPSLLKTHHMKEHLNLEPSVQILNEAQKRNEELRDNLMHLQNGEYVKIKDNLKRQISEVNNPDEPPKKILLLDEEQKRAKPKQRRKSTAVKMEELPKSPVKQRIVNVARKSTATPPRMQNVAKKSTTPRAYVDPGFSYYGTRPLAFDDIKNIKTELPVMGKNVPLNIGSMSQILQLFPVVVVDDIGDNTNI